MILENEEFDLFVNEAWDEIPESFKNELENISIVIEDSPNKKQSNKMSRDDYLLGLFEGVPKIMWGQGTNKNPGKITIFRKSILLTSRDIKELKITIRIVLMHEIAHYFGYSEKDMFVMDKSLRKKLKLLF